MAAPTLLDGIDLIVPPQANKTMVIQLARAAGIAPDPSLRMNYQELTERGRQIGPGHDREDNHAVSLEHLGIASGSTTLGRPSLCVRYRGRSRSPLIRLDRLRRAPGGPVHRLEQQLGRGDPPVTQRLHGGEGKQHGTLPDAVLTWAPRCADDGVSGAERAPAPLGPKAPPAGLRSYWMTAAQDGK